MPTRIEDLAGLDNDAPLMRSYRLHFTAIIKGSVYLSAKSEEEAKLAFEQDEAKSFDSIESFGKYKITDIEEIG